jgi:hypothetical protein
MGAALACAANNSGRHKVAARLRQGSNAQGIEGSILTGVLLTWFNGDAAQRQLFFASDDNYFFPVVWGRFVSQLLLFMGA